MSEAAVARQLRLLKKPSGCAILMMDGPGKANFIGSATTDELEVMLEHIYKDKDIKALVVTSAKADNFILGADLQEVRKLLSREPLVKLSKRGQEMFNALEQLPFPTVAAINGLCLGGGLELALCCTARLATDAGATRLGLPETRIGIVPGLGGTQRLPRLVGLKSALELILSANPVSAEEALSINLVDRLCAPDDMLAEAERLALYLVAGKVNLVRDRGAALSDEKSKKLLAITERAVRVKTRGNYPAQTRAIEAMKVGLADGIDAGLALEAEYFAETACSDVANNLMSLFFASDFARQSAQSMVTKFGGKRVETIAIIGGGVMATAIGALAAVYGFKVILYVDKERAGRTAERLQTATARVRVMHVLPPEVASERIRIESDLAAIADADFVLETTIEDIAVKTELLKQVSAVVSPTCVIASNTSCLPLSELAAAVNNPERFLGAHFFTPVERMPLVELIAVGDTDKSAIATASGVVTRMEKTPVQLKDGPGFLINRLLTTCTFEAAQMAAQGLPLSWIDSAIIEFGMPMGPWGVMEHVGFDLSCEVAQTLFSTFGTRYAPQESMDRIAAVRKYARDHGKRIFVYDETGKRGGYDEELVQAAGFKLSSEKPDSDTKRYIVERLFLPMVDEAARCLEERIVARPREVDMALVLGIGFPAFRGGVLRWADTLGLPYVVQRLEEFYAAHSERRVSGLMRKYVAAGRGFYSLASGQEE